MSLIFPPAITSRRLIISFLLAMSAAIATGDEPWLLTDQLQLVDIFTGPHTGIAQSGLQASGESFYQREDTGLPTVQITYNQPFDIDTEELPFAVRSYQYLPAGQFRVILSLPGDRWSQRQALAEMLEYEIQNIREIEIRGLFSFNDLQIKTRAKALLRHFTSVMTTGTGNDLLVYMFRVKPDDWDKLSPDEKLRFAHSQKSTKFVLNDESVIELIPDPSGGFSAKVETCKCDFSKTGNNICLAHKHLLMPFNQPDNQKAQAPRKDDRDKGGGASTGLVSDRM